MTGWCFFRTFLLFCRAQPELPRRRRIPLAEAAREIGFVFETHGLRDLTDAQRGVGQQFAGFFHAPFGHQINKGLAGFLFDQVREIVGREVGRCSRIRELDTLRQMFTHMAHHPRQRVTPAGALRLFGGHAEQRADGVVEGGNLLPGQADQRIAAALEESSLASMKAHEDKYDDLMGKRAKLTPLKRCVTADDVAETMLNLLQANRFVTGEIVVIDGGFTSST